MKKQELQEQVENFKSRLAELRAGLRATLSEGGLSHFGLFWLDPLGKSYQVNDVSGHKNMSHEEWCNQNGFSLESILRKGWIRIQALPGRYLMIDHAKSSVSPKQESALMNFFFGQTAPYPQIAVERRGEMESFQDTPQNRQIAYLFLCGKSLHDAENEIAGVM